MDNDLEKAMNIFKSKNYTCVLCKEEIVYTDTKTGIKPLTDFISSGINLNGFSAADKIVGKAGAMLFVLLGVKSVYGEVMSEKAVDFLNQSGISAFYGTKAVKIINRSGDDICPMEKAVQNVDDPQKAYEAILEALKKLSNK